MEEAQPKLEKLEKFEYFLVNKLEEKIKETLIVENEVVRIVMIQRPIYDPFDKKFHTRGLLKIGKKYYTIVIEASKYFIFIKSKPIYLRIGWDELEEGEKQ
ncbi:hypothetical protein ATV_gp26 [Bicaudavirus pozzuoliense]|uniref:Uncharacterized protein ORF100 n=2 Tax=Acidianus two-tailed virus TaxID=315953 RepID=Y100_ATV|nr:hypothetical protein ATV_gp26 [Acidianus two-tailed virus]Q3V4W0.1 RecName: Full=Uncharacterized protein ORF100 [Acidianus two-tailed virus]AON96504.1 hypothetical protein [Acidianus two-tailed phage variant 1]CAI59854.1 hypothetical protein [Acidianus two-tailed virus]